MPLPAPAPREPIHTRRVECRGYRRSDGLWDIEGHLVDTKSYPFENAFRGTLAPGDAIHEMWLRLTVDNTLTIRDVEAATDNAPYAICPAITPNFKRLIGLKIAGGFTAKSRALVGGVEGCTHLVELLGPVATTAFQTIAPLLAKENRGPRLDENGKPRRPLLLDTCHTFRVDGEVARQEWPAYFKSLEATPEVA